MIILKNTRQETFDFSLSKEYDEIGKTLSIKAKTRSSPLPDEIQNERWVAIAIKKGILVIEKAEATPSVDEKKPMVKKKFGEEV